MKKVTLDFFEEVFEKGQGVPEVFSELRYSGGEVLWSSDKKSSTDSPEERLYSIKFIPDYLQAGVNNNHSYTTKKYPQVKGYACDLEGYVDVEVYLKHQFKANAKTIRRYVNRLESCFDIRYQLFYGAISKESYDCILDALYVMLYNRFQQRGEPDESQKKWDRVRRETYELILKKRASLFVIYDQEKAIEISINYHFQNILFSSISSYNIDYAKFGLGHIEIYKQIEWCLAHNYKLFEMGRGDLDYKRRWSNTIYNFEHHIIYPKSNFMAASIALFQEVKIRLKLYLKSKNVHLLYAKLKNILFNRKEIQGNEVDYTIALTEAGSLSMGKLKLDLEQEANSNLRKVVYSYLYTHTEHIRDISLYEMEKGRKYLLLGKHTSHVIIVNNSF